MKLPSLQALWNGFLHVVQRFPIQCLIVLTAAALWISTTYAPQNSDLREVKEIVILCNLAFTLSLSARLFSESRATGRTKSLALQLLALLPPALLFIFLDPLHLESDGTRLILCMLAGHLLLSFCIWSDRLSVWQFWRFNKTLFLRFLTGFLFSVILYAGISIALMSIETLFSYDFGGDVYFRLFILISVGFNSLFFLAGIPEPEGGAMPAEIPLQTDYPKILKVFTQYVLIPLLSIYFGILIVYELKILISSELPQGTVSYLILAYSAFGILSYLLVYPLKDSSGNEWVRYFSRLFFWLMFPLLILLFVAIGVRVADYGLTEKRYLIIALAIWLSVLALYFSLSRRPRLELIPMSLFMVLVLAVVGPQNASSLSRSSQQARLRTLMESNDADLINQRGSVVRYLTDFHGLQSLQAFTERNLQQLQDSIDKGTDQQLNSWQKKQQLRDSAFNLLDVEPAGEYNTMVLLNAKNKLISTGDFERVYWLEYPYDDDTVFASESLRITKDSSRVVLEFSDRDTLSFDLGALTSQLRAKYNNPKNRSLLTRQDQDRHYAVPNGWLTLRDSSSRRVAELRLQNLHFLANDTSGKGSLLSARGFLLIR